MHLWKKMNVKNISADRKMLNINHKNKGRAVKRFTTSH